MPSQCDHDRLGLSDKAPRNALRPGTSVDITAESAAAPLGGPAPPSAREGHGWQAWLVGGELVTVAVCQLPFAFLTPVDLGNP